jgi:hypothetical protein
MSALVTEALRDVAGLGPFFEISTDPDLRFDPSWRPLRELEPVRLRELVGEYAKRLPTEEDRVAASILFQAIAARCWSPVVAAAAGHGVVPDLSHLHWRWLPGVPMGLWLPEPAEISEVTGGLVTAIHASVIEGMLRPLLAIFTETVKVAPGLMWGNAASALVGTLRPAGVRPGLAAAMSPLVAGLLELEPLAGTGAFVTPGHFVRRSCCLYYRVSPGGGYCGDCPLPLERSTSTS